MLESDERMRMSFWPSAIVLVSSWLSTVLCLPYLYCCPYQAIDQDSRLPLLQLYTVSSLSLGRLSSRRTIPLETLLQAEELSEGEVVGQLLQLLRCRLLLLVLLFSQSYCGRIAAVARCAGFRLSAGEANLGQHAFNLPQAFANLLRVLGRNIVERQR